MAGIGAYILSVVAATMICSVAVKLAGRTFTNQHLIRFVCGLVMAAVILQPLGDWVMPDLSGYFRDLESQVTNAVTMGTDFYHRSFSEDIQQRVEAYIQNKAMALGAELEITVKLEEGEYPVPTAVVMCGSISPTARRLLEQFLEEELAIRKEDQVWK